MSRLNLFERTPFDLLVRNFLTQEASYRPVEQNLKLAHPLDIYQDTEGVTFEIACTGIPKKELEILIEGQILKVNYNKKTTADEEEEQEIKKLEYIYKGIAKRSFNLGWKVDPKFDLSKAVASFDNGMLTIKIPFSAEAAAKVLKIK